MGEFCRFSSSISVEILLQLTRTSRAWSPKSLLVLASSIHESVCCFFNLSWMTARNINGLHSHGFFWCMESFRIWAGYTIGDSSYKKPPKIDLNSGWYCTSSLSAKLPPRKMLQILMALTQGFLWFSRSLVFHFEAQ